jgi:predicted amidohydrolase YtcJ
MIRIFSIPVICLLTIVQVACNPSKTADLVLLNGKIITMDKDFSIAEAVAVSGGTIMAVGTTRQVRRYAGNETEVIDLNGKTVIPGIIESHLHPVGASLSEVEHEIPDVQTMEELLGWIKNQSIKREKGEWIIHPKFFSTRLMELRQPSLAALDSVAPFHPVFLNGSYGGMVNSAAMKESGITRYTVHPGIIFDEKGLPTGFIKASATGLLELPAPKELSDQDRLDALSSMLLRYNRYGITSIFSASGSYESVKIFHDLLERDMLTTRVFQNINLRIREEITEESVRQVFRDYRKITGYGDQWVRIGQLKVVLDGGILTGTAYLREPWGEKAGGFFGFDDPLYRGVVNYSHEDLTLIISAANELGWSFTAHCTGGGGVDLLLDVFEDVNRTKPIREQRFSIIHGNFFTPESILRMNELGVYANVQPAWFQKDADAMQYILGEERMSTFHPYRSLIDGGVIINGGSDHMVKWDANTSINPYNPFIAMWTAITRITERGSVIMPSEAITREEALKMYTINNAYASFEETIKGSIEKGKLADFAILTHDILTCAVGSIRDIESQMTIVGGKIVYSAGTFK